MFSKESKFFMSKTKVSNDFLIHVYEALGYPPTSDESADLYRRQRSARETVKALMDGDDAPPIHTPFHPVDKLSETDRGSDGFGSTGA